MNKKLIHIIIAVIGTIGIIAIFAGMICVIWLGFTGIKIALSGCVLLYLFDILSKSIKELDDKIKNEAELEKSIQEEKNAGDAHE